MKWEDFKRYRERTTKLLSAKESILLQQVWLGWYSVERCNMSKYIKVEDIKDAFTENIIVSSRETAEEIVRVISAIKHRIIDLPIIEIVHCGECRWYNDREGCFFSTAEITADDYCSYGERKDNE